MRGRPTVTDCGIDNVITLVCRPFSHTQFTASNSLFVDRMREGALPRRLSSSLHKLRKSGGNSWGTQRRGVGAEECGPLRSGLLKRLGPVTRK